jgi:hypothetical protein
MALFLKETARHVLWFGAVGVDVDQVAVINGVFPFAGVIFIDQAQGGGGGPVRLR